MEEYGISPRYDRNPSPPPELRQNRELYLADKVGQSAFSKHWIFSTLMKLIQGVDEESEKPEADQSELGIDVNEELQNELCELWDMSMNADVADFLHEFKAMDILGGVIQKSKAPRVVEICVGILGNMVCSKKVCQAVSHNPVLVKLLLSLLDSRDPQTLVETSRLCHVCLCDPGVAPIWLKAIRAAPDFQENIQFLFQSSTNVELLEKTAEFVDKVLELDDELCRDWAGQDMVQALLEALRQIGYRHSEALEVYLHIFELLSTTEQGVQALVQEYGGVLVHLRKYLSGVCEYEIVGLDGRERCLSSALAVYNVIFSSSSDAADSFNQDEQGMRCLLKILEPLFPRVQELRASPASQRTSKTRATPTEDPLSTQTENGVKYNSAESDNGSTTSNVTCENDSAKSGNSSTNSNGKVETEAGVTKASSVTKPPSDMKATDPEAGATKASSVTKLSSDMKATDPRHLLLLYEVLQGFLSDIITSLHSAMPEQVGEAEEVPTALNYLNSMCTRGRVHCLITSLEELPICEDDSDPIVKLSDLAQRLRLRRLCDIIDNVPSRKDSVAENAS